MRGKIIKSAVEALEDGILWDDKLSGFGVRARGGSKRYIFKYRFEGKQRWFTIGEHGPKLSCEVARRRAKALSGDLAEGREPGKPDRGGMTVAQAVDEFVAAHCHNLRTADEYEWLIRHHVVEHWQERKLASIAQEDVVKLLNTVQKKDKTKRIRITNRVRSALMRFFKWAKSEALYKSSNPVADTEARKGLKARERVLTDGEIAAVWNASTEQPFGTIVRLLLLTAQRRSEVGGMHWGEIDLEEGMWTIPKERHKSARGHRVPLTATAVALIQKTPQVGEALFAIRAPGFNGWGGAKRELDRESGTSGWTLHDIRRTVATKMEDLGVFPHAIAAVLGHSKAAVHGVTARYTHSKLEPEKREALEKWEKRLLEIVK